MFSLHGVSAPHKPLLLMLTLSDYYMSSKESWTFEELEKPLINLLEQFGPVPLKKVYHPEYPFIRLSNDKIWKVNADTLISTSKDYSSVFLKENHAVGSFAPEVLELLKSNRRQIPDLIYAILDTNFPETIHQEIIDAIGFRGEEIVMSRRLYRDPAFRDVVLNSYEYKCAVCGLSARMGSHLVGIEAAHIYWHQAGGPDTVTNGVALCSLHHKLFDIGAFALKDDYILLASSWIHDGRMLDEVLFRFHGRKIHLPLNPAEMPRKEFIQWQRKNIFKAPKRYLAGEEVVDLAAE